MSVSENNKRACPLPLDGVRVLDLSRVFAGPLCGQVLADLGAEVIKVEHPERGDDTRDWGLRVGPSTTTYFNSMNRNKRSITLNLHSPSAVEIVHQLLPHCDVVIQNFKRGGAKRLGLGYEQLAAIKPDLVYCSVLGYGSSTDEGGRPGYDMVIQAEAGLMSVNGEAGQAPLKFGVAVVDMMTGMYAAQAVLGALFARDRSGQGRHVEVSLYDSGLSTSAYYALDALLLGESPSRFGNEHPSIVPYGLFDAADGSLVIAVGNNAQYLNFCLHVLERPDLAQDGRFRSNVLRMQNRAVLLPLLKSLIKAFSREELIRRMQAHGIPCGRVSDLHEALTSERTRQSEMVRSVAVGVGQSVQVLAPPYMLDGVRAPVRSGPPTLGEGTRDILQGLLQLSEEALQDLCADGVLTLPAEEALGCGTHLDAVGARP